MVYPISVGLSDEKVDDRERIKFMQKEEKRGKSKSEIIRELIDLKLKKG